MKRIIFAICIIAVLSGIGIYRLSREGKADYSVLDFIGLDKEELTVVIPGLRKEYNFIFISDLHIIVESDEIASENLEIVSQRMEKDTLCLGRPASELWKQLAEALDKCNVDAVLLGGDMLDFASTSNISCLKSGLDKIETPVIYVRADHDYAPIWCDGLTAEDAVRLQKEIDGYDEIAFLEFEELCVVGINNSTGNISASAVQRIKEIIDLQKPIILLTHVPLDSVLDKGLAQKSLDGWGNVLLWGAECNYVPDGNTRELLDMVYEENSLIKEVVCGHLHFSWDGYLTEFSHEHVFSPANEGKIGIIRVRGEK